MMKTFKRQWLTIIFPAVLLMAITNPSAENYYSWEYKNFKENINHKHICQGSEETFYSKFGLPTEYYKQLCIPIFKEM